MRIDRQDRPGARPGRASSRAWATLCAAAVLAGLLLGVAHGQATDPGKDDDEIEIERTVTLDVRLIDVEEVPVPGTIAIARFRVTSDPYLGSTLSLSYDYERPVRLRSWDVHDASGYRRIGGARVWDTTPGRWDALLTPGSHVPVDAMTLTLVQHDLNEDEEDRRWYFKAIESIVLPGVGVIFGPDPEDEGEDTPPPPPVP